MTRPEGAHSAPGGGGGGLGGIGGLFGSGGAFGAGSTARQLLMWGLLESLIVAIASPGVAELQKGVNRVTPVMPLDADINANAEARGILPQGAGADGALDTGIGTDAYATLLQLARQMPDVSTVMQAFWRGLIPWDSDSIDIPSATTAFKRMGIPGAWIDVLAGMKRQVPTANLAVTAFLEGQMPEEDAKKWFTEAGGDPANWDVIKGTEGSAPTPLEAIQMVHRAHLPWDASPLGTPSFHQAFLEGPWRDKWEPFYKGIGTYLPPPRTITAMLKEGALSTDDASNLLRENGLPDALVSAYVSAATHQNAVDDKKLTQSAIISLYEDQVIGKAEAVQLLAGLRYGPTNAEYLLTLADMRVAISAIKTAVSRVESSYVGHKIDRSAAQSALAQLGVPTGQVGPVIDTWTLARQANVRVLTEAQIVDAWAAGYIDQAEATTHLVDIGYTPLDAWTLLSIKNKKPLPNRPAPGPGALIP